MNGFNQIEEKRYAPLMGRVFREYGTRFLGVDEICDALHRRGIRDPPEIIEYARAEGTLEIEGNGYRLN